jgi:excisionase family DNA binding protein
VSAALAPRPAETRRDALEQIAAGLQGMAEGVRILAALGERQAPQVTKLQMVTIEEAARRLACSEDHIRSQCRSGEIKALHHGRLWRIAEADLEAYRRRRTR